MVKIIIENLAQKELILGDLKRTVLQHIHANQIDWMHACGAKGRCTTCKMLVENGMENLNPPTPAEMGYRREGLLNNNERLACQVFATGNISIRVPAASKLSHIKYSD